MAVAVPRSRSSRSTTLCYSVQCWKPPTPDSLGSQLRAPEAVGSVRKPIALIDLLSRRRRTLHISQSVLLSPSLVLSSLSRLVCLARLVCSPRPSHLLTSRVSSAHLVYLSCTLTSPTICLPHLASHPLIVPPCLCLSIGSSHPPIQSVNTCLVHVFSIHAVIHPFLADEMVTIEPCGTRRSFCVPASWTVHQLPLRASRNDRRCYHASTPHISRRPRDVSHGGGARPTEDQCHPSRWLLPGVDLCAHFRQRQHVARLALGCKQAVLPGGVPRLSHLHPTGDQVFP